MILPDFVLSSRINQCWLYSGLDSPEHCSDKKHFKSYPYTIEYQYNSRGYRDAEWPNELQTSIWCLGDSFTVGLGSPIEHTWPNILQQQLQQRTINVSMDGASNSWIARKAFRIIKEIAPEVIVIHWSYVNRREDADVLKTDEQRRKHFELDQNDSQNFIKILKQFEQCDTDTKIVHSFIPGFCSTSSVGASTIWKQVQGPSWPELPNTIDEFKNLDPSIVNELKTFKVYDDLVDYINFVEEYNKLKLEYVIPEFERLDLARDGHHYDKITATKFVDQMLSLNVFPHW